MQVCSNMVHAQRNSSIKFGVDLTCFGKNIQIFTLGLVEWRVVICIYY